MSLLLVAPELNLQSWKEALLDVDSNLEIEIWPEVKDRERVQLAVIWRDPPPVFGRFPNLKAVISPGAGADHILNEESIPGEIPIGRSKSPSLVEFMKEYLLNAVTNNRRNIYRYFQQKQHGKWKVLSDKSKSEIAIGIMGLGAIGKPVAEMFSEAGYKTSGWSRSKREIKGVETYPLAGFNSFLNETNVLICLLPMTSQTKGILNLQLFKQLQKPAYLINAGRGKQLIEEDLLYAIDKGWLTGATLDVFAEEPLPESHPFWNRDSIIITPHVSSLSVPGEIAPQIVESYKRILSGLPLQNKVNRKHGY